MTRLIESDIKDISQKLTQYDRQLQNCTGQTLRGVACHALGVQEESILDCLGGVTIAVVPIRSGQGIISGFSQTVASIVRHIGFQVFATRNSDVSGIAEAIEHKSHVLMMADDDRFIALDTLNRRIIDNTPATAKGFVAALDLIGDGLKGQPVLVLGCGPLGQNAAIEAFQRGASVSMFDINETISREAVIRIERAIGKGKPLKIEPSLSFALQSNPKIIDATNASGIIDKIHIQENTYISAPGMPLGLTPAAVKRIGKRLFHDPLQTGVAVMAIEAALLKDKR